MRAQKVELLLGLNSCWSTPTNKCGRSQNLAGRRDTLPVGNVKNDGREKKRKVNRKERRKKRNGLHEGAGTVLSFECIVVMPHHLPSNLTCEDQKRRSNFCHLTGSPRNDGWKMKTKTYAILQLTIFCRLLGGQHQPS